MPNQRTVLYSFSLALFFFLLKPAPNTAIASEGIPPHDYTLTSPNGGEFIFAMLAPYDWAADSWIRARFPKSGMYKNDGTGQLLWVADWYADKVSITSDGIYLVRWPDSPGISNYEGLVLAFYKNGQEIRNYQLNELVAEPQYLSIDGEYSYRWLSSSAFDDQTKSLAIETQDRRKYVFDVTTGEVLLGTVFVKVSDVLVKIIIGMALLCVVSLIVRPRYLRASINHFKQDRLAK